MTKDPHPIAAPTDNPKAVKRDKGLICGLTVCINFLPKIIEQKEVVRKNLYSAFFEG